MDETCSPHDPELAIDAEPVLQDEGLGESALSMEVIGRPGRPRESVMVEVTDEPNSPESGEEPLRKFLGEDQRYHTEVPRARQAYEDYVNMGVGRSLPKLALKYFEDRHPAWVGCNQASTLRALKSYSSNLDWQNRLRTDVARLTAARYAQARREAAQSTHERIRRARKLQQLAEAIYDQVDLLDVDSLHPSEARQMLKAATTMMQVGLVAERSEAGASMERLTPPKPIEMMTEEELDTYITTLRTEL